jgi:hypothetical protein
VQLEFREIKRYSNIFILFPFITLRVSPSVLTVNLQIRQQQGAAAAARLQPPRVIVSLFLKLIYLLLSLQYQ